MIQPTLSLKTRLYLRKLNDQLEQTAKELKRPTAPNVEKKVRSVASFPKIPFAEVEEVFIAGGGGAGAALPSALSEAEKYGLDLKNKVQVVCGTSVGTIASLAIAIGLSPAQMRKEIDSMPSHRFQDWNLRSVLNFFRNWGFCEGRAIPDFIRQLIKKHTKLDDPTFQELYLAGYRKELRVIVANASRQTVDIFSYQSNPHMKISKAIGIACSIPILFPPTWLFNANQELEAFTDGGIIKNYPFGIGSMNTSSDKQLGFVFVNANAAQAMHRGHVPLLTSIWAYIRNLITMLVFQDPLCLPNRIKLRTVAIPVNHSPFKFKATPKEQRALDEAGATGVKNLLREWEKQAQKQAKKTTDAAYLNMDPRLRFTQQLRRKQSAPDALNHKTPYYRSSRRASQG